VFHQSHTSKQAGKMVTAGSKHAATALKQQQQQQDNDEDDDEDGDDSDDLAATSSKAKAPVKKTTDAARDKLMAKLTDLAELCCKIGGPDPPAITQLLSEKTVAKGIEHAAAAAMLGLSNAAVAESQAQSGQSQGDYNGSTAAAAVDEDDTADLLDFDLYADGVQQLQPVPHGLLLSYVKLVLPFTLPQQEAEQPAAIAATAPAAAAAVTQKQSTAARASTVSTDHRIHSDAVNSRTDAVEHHEHDGYHDDGYDFMQEDAGDVYNDHQDTWDNPAVPAIRKLPVQTAATAATTPYSKGKSPAIAPRRSAVPSASKAAAAAADDEAAAAGSSSKKGKQKSKQKSKKSTTSKPDEGNTVPFVLSLATARAYLAELQEASDASQQQQISGSGEKKPRTRKDVNSMSSEPFLLPCKPAEAEGFKGLVVSSTSSSNPSSRLTAMLDAAVRGDLQLPLDIQRLKRAAAANSDSESGGVHSDDDSVWSVGSDGDGKSCADKQQQQQQEQMQLDSSDDNDVLMLNSSRTKSAKALQRDADTAAVQRAAAAQNDDDVLDSDDAVQHDAAVYDGEYKYGGNEYDYSNDHAATEYRSKVGDATAAEQQVDGDCVSEATVQAAPIAVIETTTLAARQFSSSHSSSSAAMPQSTSARVTTVTAHIHAQLAQIAIGNSRTTSSSNTGNSDTVQIRVDEPAALMTNGGSAHAVAALVFAVHERNCIAGGSGPQRALTLVSPAAAAAAASVDSEDMSDGSDNGYGSSKQHGVAIQVSKVKS
jgi:hypothetical protein